MAKGIYGLKIFLFRNQFKLTKLEENSLAELNCFIIKCYAVNWFTASNSEMAPLNDIRFLRKLHEYSKTNKDISEATIRKFLNHLYYLNEECLSFTLFDQRVDDDTKLKMAKKLCEDIFDEEDEIEEEIETPKKLILKKGDIPFIFNDDDKTILVKLISKKSLKMFKRFNINSDFLKTHPNTWNNSANYKYGEEKIKNLKVVNDAAERGIKLIEEFDHKITKNEEQKQFLLQTIQDYREKYPNPSLNVLKKNL
ncbi:uncharacterized protein LOC126896389 [Daktulosphaira vitifoliae]|uniref:uncharacterized protein LOC126896389 n=1 Tax=Daktulosphaira vitifoliae TaxID=58002 RepID=UPI0021A9E091|nr:uncharacterized protein LOC126896389 [Daktulosphaira vitifoliae]